MDVAAWFLQAAWIPAETWEWNIKLRGLKMLIRVRLIRGHCYHFLIYIYIYLSIYIYICYPENDEHQLHWINVMNVIPRRLSACRVIMSTAGVLLCWVNFDPRMAEFKISIVMYITLYYIILHYITICYYMLLYIIIYNIYIHILVLSLSLSYIYNIIYIPNIYTYIFILPKVDFFGLGCSSD